MAWRKGVSPVVAVIALIAVAILATLVAADIVLRQTKSLGGRGASLEVEAVARDAGGGLTAVTVSVKNLGPEDVSLSKLVVYLGTTPECSKVLDTTLGAGDETSFALLCQTGASPGDKLVVRVVGTALGTRTTVVGQTVVEVS